MSTRAASLGFPGLDLKSIVVGNTKARTADQRFGKGACKVVKERKENETESFLNWQPVFDSTNLDAGHDADAEAWENPRPRSAQGLNPDLVPKLQGYRMNLTAMSQVYNLYFAAYTNKVWVYHAGGVLAGPLGGKPAIILRPPMSTIARGVGGYIDRSHPHQANHIIIGFLGDQEVLLLAYDDGDVIGYLTRDIANTISQNARRLDGQAQTPHPAPFFRDNVGITAWGLALHPKSRLIAVSSNRFEITVFAPALVRAPDPNHVLPGPYAKCEASVLCRKRDWRIMVHPSSAGNNIPSIDFVNSPDGFAQKIVACDINGFLWLLDIWRRQGPPNRLKILDDKWNKSRTMLWGVLALPDSSFLKLHPQWARERDIRAQKQNRALALGVPSDTPVRNNLEPPGWLDVTQSLSKIGNIVWPPNPTPPSNPSVAQPVVIPFVVNEESQDEDEEFEEDEDEDEDDEPYVAPLHTVGGVIEPIWGPLDHLSDAAPPTDADIKARKPWALDWLAKNLPESHPDFVRDDKGTRPVQPYSSGIYKPHTGTIVLESSSTRGKMAFLRRVREYNNRKGGMHSMYPEIAAHTSFFITDPASLRLVTPDPDFVDLFCEGAGKVTAIDGPEYRNPGRINMLLHVPELSLVVAANQAGRVCLVTLVKCAFAQPHAGGDRGFRVDMVLPSKSDEELRLRPNASLFGVAVSPVPEAQDETLALRSARQSGSRAKVPRTYRLVLHYQDHTVLSYLVSRPTPGELDVL